MEELTIIEQRYGSQYTLYANGNKSILREPEGFEFAEVRESIDDVSGEYGAVFVNSKQGRRRVGIIGDLVGSDVYTQRRLLARALRITGMMKLVKFKTFDDLLLQFEGEVVKLLNPYTHKVHEFMVDIVAPDWRFYSQTLKSVDVGQTIIRGGTSIPMTLPASLAQPTSIETEINNILTNSGNEVTDPVITITGPGTGFIIQSITVDSGFTLDATLAEGDTVVIDVKRRSVIKNGVTNLYPSIVGEFFSLIPGENELRFLVESGLLVNVTNLNVAYRDAYNGI